jgi:hypothetical protein
LRKTARVVLIITVGTAVVWMGMHFKPSSDQALAKVFDRLAAYAKDMPDYMFEQGRDAEPRKIRVNGNQTYLTVQQNDDDVNDILDFYAAHYEPISMDMETAVEAADHMGDRQLAGKVAKALELMECMKRVRQFRYQGNGYGFLGVFEFKDKNMKFASPEFFQRLTKALETGKVGDIGTFRVTMVLKRGESGGSRIVNLWTDDDFDLNNIYPDVDGEDMPGEDIEDIPRYSGAVRQLSVTQENIDTLDRLVIYEDDGAVVSHILFYHSKMRAEGWQANAAFEKTANENSGDNLMLYQRPGRECTISIDQDTGSGKIITTIMDRKTINS